MTTRDFNKEKPLRTGRAQVTESLVASGSPLDINGGVFRQPVLVGILNITPDSFSDGGLYLDQEKAAAHAHQLLLDGANIIDIGGESTRPGAKPISAEQELTRISSAVERLSKECLVSIDTYKSSVADWCLLHGAKIINDVSALRFDPEMLAVVRNAHCQVVLMYSKEAADHPHATESARSYRDVISEIADFLKARIDYCLNGGLSLQNLIVDPGMGRFVSTNPDDCWRLLEGLHQLVEALPCPVMIGTSRKGFLGGELSERDPHSQLTGLIAAIKGATYIRTHNILMAAQFFSTWGKVMGGSPVTTESAYSRTPAIR